MNWQELLVGAIFWEMIRRFITKAWEDRER